MKLKRNSNNTVESNILVESPKHKKKRRNFLVIIIFISVIGICVCMIILSINSRSDYEEVNEFKIVKNNLTESYNYTEDKFEDDKKIIQNDKMLQKNDSIVHNN